MNRLCTRYIVCCILIALPLSGQAQSPLHWTTTNGDQYLEAKGAELHLKPRTSGTGPEIVTAASKISLPDTQDWEASFEVRFGVLRDQASSFHLTREGRDIGWIGADGFNKQIGVFIGKDNQVSASATDVEWHHVSYVSNSSSLIVLLDGKQVGTGSAQNIPDSVDLSNSQDMRVPCHQEGVWVRNVSVRSQNVVLTQVPALTPLPSLAATFTVDPLIIPLRPSDNNVTCQIGDQIQINGSVTMQKTFDSCLLLADGVVASTRTPSIPTDNYSFTWTPETPGTHILELRYTTLHARVTVRRLLVTAAASPPAVFADLPASVGVDIAVTVVGAGPHPFPVSRVELYFKDKPLVVTTAAPFTANLPIAAITQPGTYPIKFIAYDSAGHSFYARATKVEVPQRVQVNSSHAITLRNAGDKASLGVRVLPGIQVAKVSYALVRAGASDYEAIASATSAPFSADVDLSNRSSGEYQLKATVTSTAGNSYEAYAVPLTLTNVPDDNRQAQEAKARADREAQEAKDRAAAEVKDAAIAAENAKRQAVIDHVESEQAANLRVFAPRAGYDEAIFRDQLARLAYYAPELRQGTVGTVNALSVLTIDGEAITGRRFTISALVRPGSGQVNFLANAGEDSKIAVQQAAEYCKMRTVPQGWDWSRYDLTVGYDQNNVKSSGPSAGLADAIAILSCSFKLPVDNSVAMTGAVTLQGQVQRVGGVDLKAKAAFRDLNIHTLIVPADTLKENDLKNLYLTEPALCFSRRVVIVHTVDEAAREAIIGWAHSDYLHEENLVQGGLRHFARGEDTLAVAAFRAAHDTDPNNWTPTFWIAMIDLMRQQKLKDASQASSDANNAILGIKGK